jgi:outer membrane autotransporter protein
MLTLARERLIRARSQRFPQITMLATIALLTASTVSTRAQTTDWTGAVSSDWFDARNWTVGVPSNTTSANINTVTPRSTTIATPSPTPTEPRARAFELIVGADGTGVLVIQNGGLLNNVNGFIGNLPGGLGTVTVTGAGSNWENTGTVAVGRFGTGALNIQNGGRASSAGGADIGLFAGSTGTVTVTGAGSTWIMGNPNVSGAGQSGGLTIGTFGTGTLTIANGGMVTNSLNPFAFPANIGNFAGSQGTVTVTGAGSTWSNLSLGNLLTGLNIGNFGTGTLTIADSGVVTMNRSISIATNTSAIGTLNIGSSPGSPAAAAGTLNAPSLEFGAGAGTLNFNHTSSEYVFAPAISGTGTVNVLAGVTTLTAANTYGGATNVNAGTLRAGAPNTFSPNSVVTVASGGTLDLAGFDQTIPGMINQGSVRTGGSPETGTGTVLTVAGDYTAGSILALNTVLAGDGSPSDLLRIDGGTATGTTRLIVTNAGGGGALTVGDGILVVDAVNGGTTAPGAFAGFAAAGPYEYLLYRGGSTPGSENDLFLRSSSQSVPSEPIVPGGDPVPPDPSVPGGDPVPPDPSGPGRDPVPPDPSGPGRPRFRQEVSLYAAMPVMARIYGRKIIDTLHERMGGDAQLLGPGKENVHDGAWGRLIGYWGHRDGDPAGILGGGGPEFDYDFGALQTGLDLYRSEYANGQRDNAGLYIAFGRANADVQHNILGRTFKGGENDFDAVSVGGYWTRFGANNWYLDGVLQGTWYEDMTMTGRRGLRDGETNGFGFAASLEGGYPFQLGGGWQLEPQAQLVYQALDIDDFNDGASDVSYSDTDSLAGRIGARVTQEWDVGGDAKRKFTFWGRADLWYEFLDDPTTEFSSAAGFIPFTADAGDSWATLGIGAAMQVADSTSIYGNVNYDVAFDGDADAWEGKVGLKVQW